MKILLPLAEGFEEIEAVTSIDVLRRAGIDVVTASLGELYVQGSHNIIIKADINISNIKNEDYAGILLPGGIPGATNLRDNERIIELIQKFANTEKLIAAICAAPIVLERAGVISNKRATSYPGFNEDMPSCKYQEERVVIDKNIITGRGPGVSMEFALEVVKFLVGSTKEKELKKGMLIDL